MPAAQACWMAAAALRLGAALRDRTTNRDEPACSFPQQNIRSFSQGVDQIAARAGLPRRARFMMTVASCFETVQLLAAHSGL